MMNVKHRGYVLCASVALPLIAATASAENWLTVPQLCGGKAYSDTARAARWRFDRDQRVSLATKDSETIYASVYPGNESDFVVNVRVRLSDGARCRLTLDKLIFDVTNSGAETQLVTNKRQHSFENKSDNNRSWTLLTVRRRGGDMTALINGQHAVDLGKNPQAFESIGLRSSRGSIAVSSFSLTGRLERHDKASQPGVGGDAE